MIEMYEQTLYRIAAKPAEQRALIAHLGAAATDVHEGQFMAFRKTSLIAVTALKQFHPFDQVMQKIN